MIWPPRQTHFGPAASLADRLDGDVGAPYGVRPEGSTRGVLYWLPYYGSKWRWRSWPMLLPSAICLLTLLLPLHAAVLPDVAPVGIAIPQDVRDRAALLWVLAWLPLIHYLALPANRRPPIPFVPAVGVLYALYYALSPMLGADNLWGQIDRSAPLISPLDPRVDYLKPVSLALEGWIATCIAYYGARCVRTRRSRLDAKAGEIDQELLMRASFACVFLYAALEMTSRIAPLPVVLGSSGWFLRMSSQTALVILVALHRRGLLTRAQTVALVFGTALIVFVELGSGASGRLIVLAFTILVALWIDRHRVPLWFIVTGLACVGGFLAMRGAMNEWRHQVWHSIETVSPLDQSHRMIDILSSDVEEYGVAGTVKRGWTLVAHRSANVDLLADVVRRTPTPIPFWRGATYESLQGALVPRILWPGKPLKTLGQDFGHRYTYLNEKDLHTSIDLPVLIEFYINYGELGVFLGMFMVGIVWAVLERIVNQPRQGYVATAIGVPLLSQLCVIECDFSMTYGGLIMQCAAFLVIFAALAAMGRPSMQRYAARRSGDRGTAIRAQTASQHDRSCRADPNVTQVLAHTRTVLYRTPAPIQAI